MEKDSLSKRMISEWGYPEKQVESTLKKLEAMHPALIKSFEQYLRSGEFPLEPVYFGLDPRVINENYVFEPPAVFMLMDWIQRDPQNALDALVDEYRKPLPPSFKPAELYEVLKKQNKSDE